YDPVTIPIEKVDEEVQFVRQNKELNLDGTHKIPFDIQQDIVFNEDFLEFHSNGMRFTAELGNGEKTEDEYFSIGGGFVVQEERKNAKEKEELFHRFPHPVQTGEELLAHCRNHDMKISEIVWDNELSLRTEEEIDQGIRDIWEVMFD